MTTTAKIIIRDEVNVKIDGVDPSTRRKLSQKVEFFVPHAKYQPAYRLGRWDGKKTFCDVGGRTYLNLLDQLLPILSANGYDVEVDDYRQSYDFKFEKIDKDSYSHVVWPKGHPLCGKPVELREHQVSVVNDYLENIQSISICPTAAGKTVISTILAHKVEPYGKSVLIVPSKDLVTQTEEDYINFGLDVGVYFGDRKDLTRTHTICTWQSLESLRKATKEGTAPIGLDEFLNGVVCVIVDEVHRLRGNVLQELLSGPLANIPIRWGLTGTLPEDDIGKMALLTCLGPVNGVIKATDLQEKGYMAKLHINVWQLNDLGETAFGNYQSELKWLTTNRARLKFLADQIKSITENDNNTLVLIDRIETGEILHELIPNSVFLYGDIKSKDRKTEYKSIQSTDNRVIIASFGIASTGISINRIFNLVLFEPGKSFVRVIQSIGRGLRVAEDKEFVNVYDIASTCKYSKKHLTKRKAFYKEAGYPFKVEKKDY